MVSTLPSSSRRAARETALRILYMVEVGKAVLAEAQEETITAHSLEGDAATLARELVRVAREQQDVLDQVIAQHAIGFPPERQTVVDRAILRLAVAELRQGVSGVSPGVVANDAVELAKKYSTPEAARFVNGVLGAVIRATDAETGTIA